MSCSLLSGTSVLRTFLLVSIDFGLDDLEMRLESEQQVRPTSDPKRFFLSTRRLYYIHEPTWPYKHGGASRNESPSARRHQYVFGHARVSPYTQKAPLRDIFCKPLLLELNKPGISEHRLRVVEA